MEAIKTGQSHICLPRFPSPEETTTDALCPQLPVAPSASDQPWWCPRQPRMARPAPPLRTRNKLPLQQSSSLDLTTPESEQSLHVVTPVSATSL